MLRTAIPASPSRNPRLPRVRAAAAFYAPQSDYALSAKFAPPTAKLNVEVARVNGAKNSEIDQLKAKLDAVELTRKLAVTEAVGVAERERDALKNALEKAYF